MTAVKISVIATAAPMIEKAAVIAISDSEASTIMAMARVVAVTVTMR